VDLMRCLDVVETESDFFRLVGGLYSSSVEEPIEVSTIATGFLALLDRSRVFDETMKLNILCY